MAVKCLYSTDPLKDLLDTRSRRIDIFVPSEKKTEVDKMIVKYLATRWDSKPTRREFERQTDRCLFDAKGRRTNKVSSYERYFDTEEEAQAYIDANNAARKSEKDMARIRDSAPALLEALEGVLKCGRGTSGRIILEQEDELEIIAAIKQARGEQ